MIHAQTLRRLLLSKATWLEIWDCAHKRGLDGPPPVAIVVAPPATPAP